MPLAQQETIAVGVLRMVRIDPQCMKVGSHENVDRRQAGGQMRGLRAMGSADHAAAYFPGAGLEVGHWQFQSADFHQLLVACGAPLAAVGIAAGWAAKKSLIVSTTCPVSSSVSSG